VGEVKLDRDGLTNRKERNTQTMKTESMEKLDQIIRKIHKCIDEAYEENLDANCEPISDEISGNLAHAKDLLERYFL
jgi:mevalonate kinase